MEISFLAILVCAVVSMILGSVWYGPLLFGKAWMKIIGVDESVMNDPIKKKEVQKKMLPSYLLQLLLSLLQIWILSHYVTLWTDVSGAIRVIPIWLGFIMPTIAMGLLWSNLPKSLAWKSFFIQAGYYLVSFIIFGLILASW